MPRTCCSCHDDKKGYPISSDTCVCGCGYLNGWGPILGVQLFALVGMLFSIATMGDCSFVELDERLFFPSDLDENLPLKVTQTQYVGFLTWQMLDGYCYFYNHGSDPNGQIQEFMDILGTDFELARLLAMLSACLSFVYFCYLLSFTCSSQTRGVRLFNAVFLCVILTGLQGVVFIVFQSDFCEEYGCTFSRSAGFCAAAMGCFFLSGLCFLCAKEYPGPQPSHKKPKLMSMAQVAPDEQRRSLQQREEAPRNSYIYSEEFVMEDYEDEEDVVDEAEEEVVEEEEEYEEEEYTEGEVEEVTAEDDEDFEEDHPELAAGEDMTLYTEVTAEETRTVQTITHTDGSTTVTEAVQETTE